ncbi:hypothetical protein Tco_1501295 [Tanacetum coccineum]
MSQKTEALSKPALTILESSPDCGVKVAEDGAHLFVILTTVRKVKVYERSTLSEDKIVRVETGSINHEERSQCEDALSPNLGKDPEDHLKIFQAAAKTERWAMPTWCHMFNSTSPSERSAFLFHVAIIFPSSDRGGPKSRKGKKAPQGGRHQEGGHRQNFKKGGGFRSQHKQEKRPGRFTFLTKTPKGSALEKGKIQNPPPMTTPLKSETQIKFCEFLVLKRGIIQMMQPSKKEN